MILIILFFSLMVHYHIYKMKNMEFLNLSYSELYTKMKYRYKMSMILLGFSVFIAVYLQYLNN